ncbi:polysialyltransferase family glycosyltransferase [Fulvivirga sediminis]|uniref:Uncharacterized protein n=1 Tax=Fulvivirga sediminis TaxID=2803949 RepID=A0A937F303_9BACT|nr:hypothetical protein [Fulvivirga sediminis]MBL3655382.1 hypothetical protein [Fulvivirga sediminis]
MKKNKILVVWPTHREDWILPFKELSNDFEFIFLAGVSKNEEVRNYTESFAQSVYWSKYTSAAHLLNELNLDKIIFMSVDSGLNMALNMVAKSRGVITYILQHGIYTNYRDYRNREKIWRKQQTTASIKSYKASIGFSSLSWIKKSLHGSLKLNFIFIFLYVKGSQLIGPYWAAKHLSFEGKRPDYYLCFSPFNAVIHKETDRIDESRIYYVGSTELAKYLVKEKLLHMGKYYLHIDQAFADNSFGEETVSRENMINFYLKINEYCLSQNSKLLIKLHPESYGSEWLPIHENITYLRKVDNLNSYIQSAEGCFGFYSTMVIPAVYWRPTVLFSIYYSGLQEALSDFEHVQIMSFSNFNIPDISFAREVQKAEEIERKFFYQSGRSSVELLTDILNG